MTISLKKILLQGALTSIIPIISIWSYEFYLTHKHEKIINTINNLIIVILYYSLIHTILIIYVAPIMKNILGYRYIIGGIAGLIFSLLGRFYFNLPKELWKLENPNNIYIISIIEWSLLYGLIFPKLKNIFCN